jgi:type II secretory pathway pseudopilin PulG
VLFLVAAMGAGLAAIGTWWSTVAQRDREEELLFTGEQFRGAIRSYYDSAPDGVKVFPRTLQDLVEDNRGVKPLRHLRQVFRDPMTGTRDWGVIRAGDRITGVHSLHAGAPIRRAGFTQLQEDFASANSYRDWKFVFSPVAAPVTAPVRGSGAPAGPTVPATGPVTAPVAGPAVPDATPVEVPAPPPVRRRDEVCELQRSDDLRTCAAARTAGATTTEVAVCTASAASRYFACVREQTIPPLRLPPTR